MHTELYDRASRGSNLTVNDKVIVITGAGGGMGTACAAMLGADRHLILVDLDDTSLDRARDAAAATATAVTTVRCDVTRTEDVALVADAVNTAGALRAVVHTAGVSPQMANGRRVVEVDLVGTARVLDALEPMVVPGTAAICIGSIAGYSDIGSEADALLANPLEPGFLDAVEAALGRALDSDTGYALAKRGVMLLCEQLSGPWGARGGRVISIAPGLIDTEMGRMEFEKQEVMKAMAEFTPIKRPGPTPLPGRADDIAQLVAFLCSDRATFISGCDIRVDGGLVGAGRHLGLGG
jgi:NAD(P)-dependent dehydrogenase (short-subunit alcohol dehydrogenase family)